MSDKEFEGSPALEAAPSASPEGAPSYVIPHPGKPGRWICSHCSVDLFASAGYVCPTEKCKSTSDADAYYRGFRHGKQSQAPQESAGASPDPRYAIVDALVSEFGWGVVMSACETLAPEVGKEAVLPGTLTVTQVENWWSAKWVYGNSECSFLSPDKTKAVAFVMDYAQREMIRLDTNPQGEGL